MRVEKSSAMELSNDGSMEVQHSIVPNWTHHQSNHFHHCPHHHLHILHCPHHHHILHCPHHHHHPHLCSLNQHSVLHHKHNFTFLPPPRPLPTTSLEPESVISVPTPGALDVEVSGSKELDGSEDQLLQEEFAIEEEDEEPMYVMTEEWMEFFAKSEAKRRLEKQAKKKKNKKKQGN